MDDRPRGLGHGDKTRRIGQLIRFNRISRYYASDAARTSQILRNPASALSLMATVKRFRTDPRVTSHRGRAELARVAELLVKGASNAVVRSGPEVPVGVQGLHCTRMSE